MEKTVAIPLWVTLAFSSIRTRRGAMNLVLFSVLFCVYCLPWSLWFPQPWVETWFLADDWSWVAMMIAVTAWYVVSLRWMDRNHAWEH